MNHLKKKQSGLLISEQDIYNVSIAGLCHDLGHGPFSHVFDNHFLRTVNPTTDWTHEWASTNLLRYMVDKSQSDTDEKNPIDLSQEDVNLICDLIEGETRGRSESKSCPCLTVIAYL
jgi:HD superfamily phosphohydrolase